MSAKRHVGDHAVSALNFVCQQVLQSRLIEIARLGHNIQLCAKQAWRRRLHAMMHTACFICIHWPCRPVAPGLPRHAQLGA